MKAITPAVARQTYLIKVPKEDLSFKNTTVNSAHNATPTDMAIKYMVVSANSAEGSFRPSNTPHKTSVT